MTDSQKAAFIFSQSVAALIEAMGMFSLKHAAAKPGIFDSLRR